MPVNSTERFRALRLRSTGFDIEMLQMVANLVHMAAPGQVPPALWKYFEFAVLSLSSLDLKAQFGNKLLELPKQNVENYNECIQYSIELIVNFSAREPQRVAPVVSGDPCLPPQ